VFREELVVPKLPEAEPLETQAALAGADVELVAGDHPEEVWSVPALVDSALGRDLVDVSVS